MLLHSIIFQRALGEGQFQTCESELLDVAYVKCDSRPINQRIDEYADAFSSALERTEATRRALICVSFVERRARPAAFGFFRSDEKVTWERWQIALSVRSAQAPPENLPGSDNLMPGGVTRGASQGTSTVELRQRQQQQLAHDLREQLEVILTTAASRKEHIPPSDGLGGNDPTWFEVSSDASDSWSSGLDIFKLGFARAAKVAL